MIKSLSFNPFENFIGKTIENIEYFKGWIEIKFKDGSSGYVDVSIPEGTPRDKVLLSGRLYD